MNAKLSEMFSIGDDLSECQPIALFLAINPYLTIVERGQILLLNIRMALDDWYLVGD